MRRTPLASTVVLAGGLLLAGCSGSSSGGAGPTVPTPVATIPLEVAQLSQTVGEYVVAPSRDLRRAQVEAAVTKLQGMAGVQSASLSGGKIHVVLLPAATTTQREALERQLAALGTVSEGI